MRLRPRRIAVALTPALLCAALAGGAARAQERDLDIPLMVQTVPRLPGARFTIDDRTFTADEHGLALVTVNAAGTFRLGAPAGERSAGGGRVEFARWSDDVSAPEREITVDSFTYLEAGFDTLREITPTFVDAAGHSLGRIDSLVLIDDRGSARTYQGAAPLWLRTARVTAVEGGLRRRPVAYRLGRVRLADGTVLWLGRRPPEVPAGGVWRIEVSFHDVAIVASDALFGAPVAGEATLRGPDGSRRLDLDEKGRAVAESLPPGRYVARVEGGLAPSETSFTLPGDSSVQARVLTVGDAAALVLVVMVIVAAAVAARRISRRRLRRRPAPPRGTRGSLTTAGPSSEGVHRGGDVRTTRLLRPRARRASEAAAEPETTDVLTAKLQALADEIDTATAALSELRRQNGAIEAQLASERAGLEVMQRDRKAVEAGLASERDELRAARDRVAAELDRVATEARVTEAALRAQLDSLASERDSLTAALRRERARAARTEAELVAGAAAAERSSERDALVSERDVLRRQRDGLEAAVSTTRAERDALHDKLKNALTQLVAATEARAERDDLRAERDETRAELAAVRADRDALRERLEAALARLGAVGELRAERDDLRAATPRAGSGEADPLHQALGRLVHAEEIRTQREQLLEQVEGLRRENGRLHERLRQVAADPADEGVRVAPEPPPRGDAAKRPVVRLEDGERAEEEGAESRWRASISEGDRY